MDILGAIMDI